MIQLLQLLNHMYNLEYTELDIRDYMSQIENGELYWEDLLDGLGLSCHPETIKYLEKSGSKWDSALYVVMMRRGLI